jgi:hypothetical protein
MLEAPLFRLANLSNSHIGQPRICLVCGILFIRRGENKYLSIDPLFTVLTFDHSLDHRSIMRDQNVEMCHPVQHQAHADKPDYIIQKCPITA